MFLQKVGMALRRRVRDKRSLKLFSKRQFQLFVALPMMKEMNKIFLKNEIDVIETFDGFKYEKITKKKLQEIFGRKAIRVVHPDNFLIAMFEPLSMKYRLDSAWNVNCKNGNLTIIYEIICQKAV